MAARSSGARSALVVIEGLDGAGTTTQTRRLVEALDARGLPVTRTREPSDGPVGMLIRQMLSERVVAPDGEGGHRPVDDEVLALLFAADRLDHLDAEIVPALERGRLVVTDRYYHSSLAYQSDTRPDGAIDTSWVRTLNERAREPDLTIFLDASPEVCLQRLETRGRRDIFESPDELAALADRYRAVLAELEAAGETLVRLDAEASLEDVQARILEEVESHVDLSQWQ